MGLADFIRHDGRFDAVGVAATLVAVEPLRAKALFEAKGASAPLSSARGFFDAVIGPFTEFFASTAGWRC